MVRLELSRSQILGFRRNAGSLDERLPAGVKSLRMAAWAGLQDSSPRAALLSIHARVEDTASTSWEHPSLVQLWGPRFSDYVVAAKDVAVFSLGRLPEDARRRARAHDTASRLHTFLDGRRMAFGQAGREMHVAPNSLRYAAPTGTVLMRWDGARQPIIWTAQAPAMEPRQARVELVRRYLHIFGPATSRSFAHWAGIGKVEASAVFGTLADTLIRPARRSATHGSWPMTRRRSGTPAPGLPRPRASCPAAMRTICCGARIERSWSPMRSDERNYGRRAFGPAHCWWTEKLPGFAPIGGRDFDRRLAPPFAIRMGSG